MTARHRKSREAQAQTTTPQTFDPVPFISRCFGFWRACGVSACRRNRVCSGDTKKCFDRLWPIVPEQWKMQLRATIKAAAAGSSPKEAVDIGIAEGERWAEQEAASLETWSGQARCPDEALRNPGAESRDEARIPRSLSSARLQRTTRRP